ncbi:Cytochrome 82C4 [Capsicum baccatum]|uniref:Cytochrome 82C4 n=1 Tax=Capsicum baccatum TaxID=33114 RepID=A0A2G2X146_CAPBA|nr:Cytochrome 82C4 [Capsicum baccatum]
MFGIAPYGPYWREMRKIVTIEFLSARRIDMFSHVREIEVKSAVKKTYGYCLKNKSSNLNDAVKMEMKEWLGNLIMNTMVKILFGVQYTGVHTTLVTLTWTLSLLLNNDQSLKRAQDELDTHVGKNRRVQESDIKNLVYLQAIVKESLRLYSPVPLMLPHESIEDCVVSGYDIPKWTRLLVNISKFHRDPKIWPNPHEFKPERFLTTHKMSI